MSKKYYACVYGGASNKIDDVYIAQIEKLGKIIVENGFSLVFGAGASGCMGAAAWAYPRILYAFLSLCSTATTPSGRTLWQKEKR